MGQLPYNQASTKASHNSYQRREPFVDQFTWHPDKTYNAGCGVLELDISQSSDGLQGSAGDDGAIGPAMLRTTDKRLAVIPIFPMWKTLLTGASFLATIVYRREWYSKSLITLSHIIWIVPCVRVRGAALNNSLIAYFEIYFNF